MKDYSQIADEKSLFDCYLERVYDKGYNKGYADNNKDFAAGVREAYKNGLNDAWKCAIKIDTNRELEEYVFGKDLEKGYEDISAVEAIDKIKEYEEKQKAKQTERSCNNCVLQETCLCGQYAPKIPCEQWTYKACDTCKYSSYNNNTGALCDRKCINRDQYAPVDDEIKVGDELIIDNMGSIDKVIVTYIHDVPFTVEYQVLFCDGSQSAVYPADIMEKTGRHFDQIEEVSKALRGE